MVDQTDAQGNSLKFTQNGTWADGTPRYSAAQTLGAAGQALQNTNQQTQQSLSTIGRDQAARLGSILNKEIDYSGVPALQTSFDRDWSADRTKVEDALFSRLNPQMENQRDALETRLSNQGIKLGSTAYDRALSELGQTQNDQRTSVVLQGGQEQSRLAGLDQAAASFGNNARSQSLSELYASRQAPLNEISALMSGSQVSAPQLASTPQTQVAGTDIAGINQGAANTAQQQYGAQMGQYNSVAGGLFGLGASALMAFSDRRLKTDIEATGETVAGVPVKSWTWKGTGQRDTGVIAQDLEKKHPELVDKTHPSGFRRVNYGGLMQLGATAKRAA